MGNLVDAERLFRQVIDGWSQTAGSDYSDARAAQRYHGLCLMGQGRTDEAEAQFRITNGLTDAEDTGVKLICRLRRTSADALCLEEKLESARDLATESVTMFTRILGPTHAETLMAKDQLLAIEGQLGGSDKTSKIETE